MFPIYPSGGVHHKIRTVLAEFGVKETHQALLEIMKSDYEYLGTLFTQSNEIPQTTTPIQEKKEKKPVKKANKESDLQEQTETNPSSSNTDSIDSLVTSKFTPGTKILVTKEKIANTSNINVQELPPATLPKFSSSTEAKQWQREQEEARRVNNEERGINSETLLTSDNMREWIEVNKYTYAQIARDIVGLPEYRVAEFAKQNGILSETAKRRAAIIARAKSKK